MSVVIGLGETGCAIADEFKKYPQYIVYNILADTKRTSGRTKYIKPALGAEEYEKNCPSFKNFLRAVSGDVLLILDGAELVTAAALRILSHIKECNISVLYVKSESSFISQREKLNQAAVFGVLQEYARSAVFDKMILVDISLIATALPNLTVKTYHSKIREAIASTLHMIEIYSRTASDLGNPITPHPAARLMAVGTMDINTGKENMFFPLDYPREKCYYYAINEKKLESDSSLLGKITDQVSDHMHPELAVSYGIYSTDYDADYVFVTYRSSAIQK
jgi:hypothetical protein